jgi:hypothetical protein
MKSTRLMLNGKTVCGVQMRILIAEKEQKEANYE